jgi:uncharacterized membrane protein
MSGPTASLDGVRRVGSDSAAGAARRRVNAAALVHEHAWTLAVWAAMIVWAITLFVIVRDRHADFRFARYDLGNMVQAVWSTAQGRPLETTNGETGEQMVRLGSHVDPILGALAPLWIVLPSPLTLAAVQVVAVALGALPLFWLARGHLGSERAAGLLALTYLVYPWTAWAALDVFHPVILAIPLFLYCVWFLDTGRLVAFAICAVLAATTGELMGLVVATLGVWYAVARGRTKAGLAIAVAGTGWTLFALIVVVPAFADGPSVFYGAYEEVGGSPWGVVRTAFTDPATLLSAVSRGNDLLYVLLLAVPLGGLFLLAPGLAAVALPQLAANLLASRRHTTDPHVHYVAGILPFLFAATAIGLARFSLPGRVRGASLVLTVSLAAAIALGPWPGTLLGAPNWDTQGTLDTTPGHVRALDRAVALVPEAASVSTTNRLGSHLAARRYFYSAPVVGRAEWILIDSSDTWTPKSFGGETDPEVLLGFRERIERSPQWHKVFEENGVVVFRKIRT